MKTVAISIRIGNQHKRIAIEYSKLDSDCPRPDCGSVTHGIKKALELAEQKMKEKHGAGN